jgi:hypothetical protein
MLQHLLSGLKDKTIELVMILKNHAFWLYKIKITNFKALSYPNLPTLSEKMPIITDISSNNSGIECLGTEETVIAAPPKNRIINKGHRLIDLSAASGDKTYLLDKPKIMIGRDRSSHIRINQKTASLFHAMLSIKENECTIKDLDSKNGTLVNGSLIKHSLKLKDGDKIEIGSCQFAFFLRDPGHSQWSRKPWNTKHLKPKAFAMISIIFLAFIVSLPQLKNDDSQIEAMVERQMPISHDMTDTNNEIDVSQKGNWRQQQPIAKERAVSLIGHGQQLIEKATQHYLHGNIALSLTLVEETLQLNIPDDDPLITKAAAIKDSIEKAYLLYKEGLGHYNQHHSGKAILSWSKALKADQQIAGSKSSHFANQIASHTGDIFYKMAKEAYKHGNNKEAQEFCLQTFRAQPSHKGCIEIVNPL